MNIFGYRCFQNSENLINSEKISNLVSNYKRMSQIVKTEVFDLCPLQGILKPYLNVSQWFPSVGKDEVVL